jgi:translocation and assembly module TamB
VLGIVAIVVVVLGVGGVALQTRAGKDWLAGEITALASGPESRVIVSGIEGAVPFDMRIARVELADREGTWLVAEDVAARIRARDLLSRRLHVLSAGAARVEVRRAPVPSTAPPPKTQGQGFHLPRGISVDDLSVPRIELGAPLVGQAATLSLHARAEIPKGAGDASAHLDVARLDGVPARVLADLGWDDAARRLDLDLAADDAAGGLVSSLAAMPDLPPVRLRVVGHGPIDDWKGTIDFGAGDAAKVAGTLGVTRPSGDWRLLLGLRGEGTLLAQRLPAPIGDAPIDVALETVLRDTMTEIAAARLGWSAGILTANGTVGADGSLALNVDGDVPDLARYAALAGRPIAGAAKLAAKIAGTISAPRATLDATLADLALDGAPPPLVGPKPILHVEARADEARRVTVDALTLDGAALTLLGNGRLADGRFDAVLGADVAPAESGLPSPVSAGQFRLDVVAGGTLAPLAIEVQAGGEGRDLALTIPALAAALGPTPHFALAGSVAPDALRIETLALDGAALSLTGPIALDEGMKRLSTKIEARVAPVEAIAGPLGVPATGAVGATLDASGRLDALKGGLVVTGEKGSVGTVDLAGSELRVDVESLAPRVAGAVRARIAKPAATSVATRFALADGTLRLDELALDAPGAKARGAVETPIAAPAAKGRVDLDVSDLGGLLALAGMQGSGVGNLRINLDAPKGRQSVGLTGGFRDVAAAGVRLASMRLDGKLDDALGAARGGTLDVRLAGLAAPVAMTDASLALRLKGQNASYTLKARSDAKPGYQVEAGGDGAVEEKGWRLDLARLTGKLAGLPLGLGGPARVTASAGETRLSGLDLRLGPGTVRGDARVASGAIAAKLDARDLPMRPLGAFAPSVDVRGRVDAALDVDAGPKGARGTMTFSGRELRFGDLSGASRLIGRRAAAGELPTLSVDGRGTWDGKRADLQVTALGGGETRLDASGGLPVVWKAREGTLGVAPDAPVDARLKADADLARIAALLPTGEDRILGRLTADYTVDGTLTAPRPHGTLRLTGGRYEGAAYDTVIADLEAELVGDGTAFRLTRLDGTDGGDGRLGGSGEVRTGDGGFAYRGDINLKGFRVARRDTLSARADAGINAEGDASGGRISGAVKILEADATLPSSLPPSVPNVPVTEINVPGAPPPGADQAANAPAAAPVALAIAVDAPGRILVHGRGLDSEWRGNLDVGGTVAAPAVTGTLSVVRGSLSVAGKRFPIDRGTVTIPPGAMTDPIIQIEATLPGADVVAKAVIEGPVSAPRLTLTSDPALPQDEILSRVLFGRNVSSLSPMQAVTLAQSALELSGKTGSGGGPLDRVRRFLGLDRLDVGSSDEPGTASAAGSTGSTSGGGPTAAESGTSGAMGGALSGSALSAGRYIAPGVYVGVRQGVSGGSPAATVDVQISPSLSLESSVGGSGGGGGVGLNYRRDY